MYDRLRLLSFYTNLNPIYPRNWRLFFPILNSNLKSSFYFYLLLLIFVSIRITSFNVKGVFFPKSIAIKKRITRRKSGPFLTDLEFYIIISTYYINLKWEEKLSYKKEFVIFYYYFIIF